MSKRFIIVEHATLKFNRFLGTSLALFCAVGFLSLWGLASITHSKWHDLIVEAAAMIGFINNLFTLQRAQNKDLKAIHLKLDELIASSDSASNRMIKMEEAPEHILDQIHEVYREAAMSVKDDPSRLVISLDEADEVLKVMHEDLRESDELGLLDDQTTEIIVEENDDKNVEIDMRPPRESEKAKE